MALAPRNYVYTGIINDVDAKVYTFIWMLETSGNIKNNKNWNLLNLNVLNNDCTNIKIGKLKLDI